MTAQRKLERYFKIYFQNNQKIKENFYLRPISPMSFENRVAT